MLKTFGLGALGAVAAIALALPAGAQSIDYGSLEEVFGEPVTTSATGKPQRASEAPVSMEIITQDEIRRSGAVTIPDILQRVVGLDVFRWASGSADVAVHGLNKARTPRLLVLINGRQVYMDHFGNTNWFNMPVVLSEIRQIEVVKSPNSALFGFNAAAGVINIVTYNPLTDSVNHVQVTGGTQSYREVEAVTTVNLNESLGIRLTAQGSNQKEFEKGLLPADRNLRFDPKKRMVKLDGLWQVQPGLQVGAEFANSHTTMLEMSAVSSLLKFDQDAWSGKLSVNANTGIGLIEAVAYRNDTDIDSPTLFYNNQVSVARIQDLFKIGTDHTFRISGEYRRNDFMNNNLDGGKLGYDVYSAAGMWDWMISDQWNLVTALRYDLLQLGRSGKFARGIPFTNADYDRNLQEPSYNVSLVHKLTEKDTLRFAVARGIELPSLYEFGVAVINRNSTQATGSVGSPLVDPAIVDNYEFGWDRSIDAIGGGSRLSVYYQTNKDIKGAFIPVAPGLNGMTNIGDTDAWGFDASLKGTVGQSWFWSVGYAFEKVSDDFDVVQTLIDFENTTPVNKLYSQVTYASGPLELNLFGQYVSDNKMVRSGLGLVDISDYTYVAASAGYRILDNVRLSVSAFNITNPDAQLTPAFAEERRVYGSISVDF